MWDSTACAVQCVWGDHGGAFCYSYLWLIVALSPSPIFNKLPPSWKQLDSLHPKSPVSSSMYLCSKRLGRHEDFPEALNHLSLPPTLPLTFSLFQTLLPSVQWYLPELLSHLTILHSFPVLHIYLFTEKWQTAFFYSFILPESYGRAKFDCSLNFRRHFWEQCHSFSSPAQAKGIWNTLPIIRVLTNATLMYSEAHSK